MPAADDLTPADIEAMVLHWSNTPAHSYLGSSYGENFKNMLQRPMVDLDADEVIEKLLTDIPILRSLPAGVVNVYAFPRAGSVDESDLFIDIAGRSIRIPGG